MKFSDPIIHPGDWRLSFMDEWTGDAVQDKFAHEYNMKYCAEIESFTRIFRPIAIAFLIVLVTCIVTRFI